ncbi:uncharacterized protein [Medicago truncatula]|uniref:RPA-interacting protein n=1 Tax=Medicago truncatula TaxID=3880 RepID=A0A072V4Z1_MEDTR|nr:uncharacterized protein LOC11421538 isoform X2 [Medicago truncatula]KEH36393.1 hypothetical protein MTR_3g118090 [Medicago truncatula]
MEEIGTSTTAEKKAMLRPSLKSDSEFNNYQLWKQKLRENCFKRVRQDRSRLLWKCRLSSSDDESSRLLHNQDELDIVFRDIVSDELNKINNDDNDLLWNDDLKAAHEGDCQDILLEMQNLFYQDLDSHIDTWEDEVDHYLARAVYDHMHLNPDNNTNNKTFGEQIWCPLCKQGQLKDTHNLIYCTRCKLQLTKADESCSSEISAYFGLFARPACRSPYGAS